MKSLQRKLHSKAGASMVLALLFLFFCLMVGAVVLTAAASNTGRLARNRQDRQNELAVESAALLLGEDLTKLRLVGQYSKTTTVTETTTITDQKPTTAATSSTSYAPGKVTLSGANLSQFGALHEDFAALLYSAEPALGVAAPTSMRYELAITEAPPVQAVLTVETDYTLSLRLGLEDGSHAMTLRFRTNDQSPPPAEVTTSETVLTGEDGADGSVTTTVTVTTYTKQLRWQTPEITQGVQP